MATKTRIRVPYLDLAGGLNEDDNPAALQPNELRVARNVYWKGRALSTRFGSARLQTTAINSGAAVTGVYQLVRNQGADLDNIAVVGNKIYSNAKGLTPTDITGAVTITAGQNNQVTFTNFNNIVYMANGVDNPWEWSGSGNAAAVGGTPPVFKTMLAKWGRLFGAGHAAAPRTIRFSALNDGETWAAGNTAPATLSDASGVAEGRDYIQQLGHLGDAMFVGLRESIGRVLYTGDATVPFRYNQLSEFGCEGAHSYVAVGERGYFLSTRGVHVIQPSDILITYESSEISGRRLRTFWRDLNKSRIQRTYGTLYRTNDGNTLVIWPLTVGSGTIHDVLLVMDVTDGPGKERFTTWSGWDANSMAAVRDTSSGVEELLFGSTVGFIWEGDNGVTDDNGSAYSAEGTTRWEDFGAPAEKKNFRDIYIEASASGSFNLTIDTYFDYSTTPTQTSTQSLAATNQATWDDGDAVAEGVELVWGTSTWPTQGFIRDYLFGVDDGVVMSFRFSTSGANQPWSIYKVVPAVEAIGEAKES